MSGFMAADGCQPGVTSDLSAVSGCYDARNCRQTPDAGPAASPALPRRSPRGRDERLLSPKPDSENTGTTSITIQGLRAGWNVMKPRIQCVRTHWNSGFTAFAPRTWAEPGPRPDLGGTPCQNRKHGNATIAAGLRPPDP